MKVLVGLSGGVDSAVAAYLLKEEGHEVVGGFMKNYTEDSGACTTREDAESAIEVAKFLGIELQVFDFQKEYEERILNYIFEGYSNGITPNPDILCNNLVKFDLFLDAAIKMGFDKIAMGHYARVGPLSLDGGSPLVPLKKGDADVYLGLTAEDIKKRGSISNGYHLPYNPQLVDRAKKLRKNMTLAEKKLRYDFFKTQKIKVLRQQTIDHFIVDFYVASHKLVIELDGIHHQETAQKEYDTMRTDLLNIYGITVVRFSNVEIFDDFDSVCSKIQKYLSTPFCNGGSKGGISAQRGVGRGSTHQKENIKLYRGKDHNKDQSYFLSGLNQQQLSKSLFPLGNLEKTEVRELAHKIGLPNADRKDSQGLCFVGNIPIKDFLMKKLPVKQGDIMDEEGTILGQHDGAWFFTIGQNRGLKLNHKAYVYKIDVTNNIVYVSKDKESSELTAKKIRLYDRNWIGEKYTLPLVCQAKIRYRQEVQDCKVEYEAGEIFIVFEKKQWAIAPGQTIVAYLGEECVGSGIISSDCSSK